jgi:hypothetical protein
MVKTPFDGPILKADPDKACCNVIGGEIQFSDIVVKALKPIGDFNPVPKSELKRRRI